MSTEYEPARYAGVVQSMVESVIRRKGLPRQRRSTVQTKIAGEELFDWTGRTPPLEDQGSVQARSLAVMLERVEPCKDKTFQMLISAETPVRQLRGKLDALSKWCDGHCATGWHYIEKARLRGRFEAESSGAFVFANWQEADAFRAHIYTLGLTDTTSTQREKRAKKL